MLDFFAILALTYFIGLVPLGRVIKTKASINVWNENDEQVGVMKIYRLLGMEWASALLLGYFLKGYLGLWTAHYLWGNDFINLTAALLLVLGQSSSWFSQEKGGVIVVFLGAVYFWDSALGGALMATWISSYLFTKRVNFASLITAVFCLVITFSLSFPLDLVFFTLITALLLLKKHIFTIRTRVAGRGN